MSIVILKSILIFLLISTYIFYLVDLRKFNKILKKYLLSTQNLLNFLKDNKKIEVNLLKEKLDDITKNGSFLIISFFRISLPFIISLFAYRFIGLNFSMKFLIAISSLPYFILLLK